MITPAIQSALLKLGASLQLIRITEQIIPKLVEQGLLSDIDAGTVLARLPSMRTDLGNEQRPATERYAAIEVRIKIIANFLHTQRARLPRADAETLNHCLQILAH